MTENFQIYLGFNYLLSFKREMPRLFRELCQVHGISRAWNESEYSLHCHISLQYTAVFSKSEISFVLPQQIWSKCPGTQGSFKISLLKKNAIYHPDNEEQWFTQR